MLNFIRNRTLPIGADLGSGHLRMAQLEEGPKGLALVCAAYEKKPEDVEPGSPDWQRWAIKAAKEMIHKNHFRGQKIITALPSDDVFIDQIKIPRTAKANAEQAVLSKIKHKLPFDDKNAQVKYIVAEHLSNLNGEMDVVVMATETVKIQHHLAIYEKAGLLTQSITVWPLAIINSHINFFGRRKDERETVVMLMDVGSNHTNIVICRHKNLLFARVIPIGKRQLCEGQMVQRLMAEVDACCRYFESVSGGKRIERLMLLSGKNIEKDICEQAAGLAQKLQVPAQIGDVLGAVKINGDPGDIDRREGRINWATAFGLSLAGRAETEKSTNN